jgi:hypothetical protein
MNHSTQGQTPYMTTIDRPGPLAVQPADSYVCPSWCILSHISDDLSEWDTGLWLITHQGEEHRWETARGTEMTARLKFVEVVGWNTMPPDGDYTGPYIELGGSDGSGYAVPTEIDALDVAKWGAMLITLGAEVLP